MLSFPFPADLLNYDNILHYKIGSKANFTPEQSIPALTSNFGYYNKTSLFISSVGFHEELDPRSHCYTLSSNFLRTYLYLEGGNVGEEVMVADMTRFDETIKTAHVLTNIQGKLYFAFSSSYYIELGYGKNQTAFYNPKNPLQINVYFNDGGYCVKSVIGFNEDKTEINLLSQTIIGTYDAYFETDSDVYFVEKDGKLLMFKK